MIKDFDSIVYHSPCSDGIGALWCALHYKNIINKIPCKAGTNPNNDFVDQNVIFVDLCPKIDYLIDLCSKAKYVVILDHHKSAEDMINSNFKMLMNLNNLYLNIDMNRSGCMLSWDYFFGQTERPKFINYIGDRDLWKWELKASKEINTALYELNYIDPNNIEKLTELLLEPDSKYDELEQQGKIILQINKRELDICIQNAIECKFFHKNKKYRVWLGGNISPSLRSDFGNMLLEKQFRDGKLADFSATWQFEPRYNEWWISLRGNSNSPDLSIISTSLGGGGHKNASGFTIRSPKNLRDFFIF